MNIDNGVERAWNRVGRNAELPRPPYLAIRKLRRRGDQLAFRWYMLRREGRHTLHNIILGDHGLPNRK